MPVFKGNTSTNATSTAYDNPAKILSFSIVNKSGGAITVNVGILSGSTFAIVPYNLAMDAGDILNSDDVILLPVGYQISVVTSGNIDYFFTIESTKL